MEDRVEIDADQIVIALARGGRMPQAVDPATRDALAAARNLAEEIDDDDVPILAD